MQLLLQHMLYPLPTGGSSGLDTVEGRL